jgi:hypothetical protein
MSESELVDFDYSVRLALSSNSLSTMKKPLLLLDLTLKHVDGTTKNKVLELSESDLDLLLKNFDNIGAVLDKWP